MSERDDVFSDPARINRDFHFGDDVARVFDDMVSRSIPFYAELQRMTVDLARSFMKDGTTVYDLGCATGTTLRELAVDGRDRDIQFIGVDNSKAMLDRAGDKLAAAGCLERCDLELADLDTVRVHNASVIVLILTLQFIRPPRREMLIRRLSEGLVDDGALVLVEK